MLMLWVLIRNLNSLPKMFYYGPGFGNKDNVIFKFYGDNCHIYDSIRLEFGYFWAKKAFSNSHPLESTFRYGSHTKCTPILKLYTIILIFLYRLCCKFALWLPIRNLNSLPKIINLGPGFGIAPTEGYQNVET